MYSTVNSSEGQKNLHSLLKSTMVVKSLVPVLQISSNVVIVALRRLRIPRRGIRSRRNADSVHGMYRHALRK